MKTVLNIHNRIAIINDSKHITLLSPRESTNFRTYYETIAAMRDGGFKTFCDAHIEEMIEVFSKGAACH